jgi:hypothetical protein
MLLHFTVWDLFRMLAWKIDNRARGFVAWAVVTAWVAK